MRDSTSDRFAWVTTSAKDARWREECVHHQKLPIREIQLEAETPSVGRGKSGSRVATMDTFVLQSIHIIETGPASEQADQDRSDQGCHCEPGHRVPAQATVPRLRKRGQFDVQLAAHGGSGEQDRDPGHYAKGKNSYVHITLPSSRHAHGTCGSGTLLPTALLW